MSKHSIKVTSIHCNATSELNITDGDEVYLSCQADGGIPIRYPNSINKVHKMKKGDTWSPSNLVLNFEYEVLLSLWDHDLNADPNVATYLQGYDFRPGSGSSSVTLKNLNGANYTIYFTYLN